MFVRRLLGVQRRKSFKIRLKPCDETKSFDKQGLVGRSALNRIGAYIHNPGLFLKA
jgi:hypothetical protein